MLRAVDAEAFALGLIAFAPRDELQGIGNTDLGLMIHRPVFV